MAVKKMTMGIIVGNRGFFPGQLAKSGREEMIQALAKAGIDSVGIKTRVENISSAGLMNQALRGG